MITSGTYKTRAILVVIRMTFSTTWFQFQFQRVMDESGNFCSYRRVHGESTMSVEYGKKENRSEPGFSITVDEFLRVSVL